MEDIVAIHLEFPCSDGGTVSGLVSVTPLSPRFYRLEETPFVSFVDEAAFGDVIEVAQIATDRFVFQQVVQPSQYNHLDWVLSEALVKSESFQQLLQRVTDEEGHWEIVFGGVVFVHLPLDSEFDVSGEMQKLFVPTA